MVEMVWLSLLLIKINCIKHKNIVKSTHYGKDSSMTPELQKYYEDRFSMMASDGWKELLIDIDNMIVSLNNISVIQDEKSLQLKKGELSILNWLKTLKQVSERAYEDLNEKNI
ncbi:hypothetical protein UFOVP1457_16 [uncultured Caudovirales phage]|uniref:Uncharacterized protein n=1 Tax=uncultured Caudovirales phage TaxID=2100421 RepID=A0A6J5SJR7_9CAUD|nr:hypothetical protein UFOVP1457_16 [uncultured Caudovirales phage]